MKIQAEGMHFQALNDLVRQSGDSAITIDGCIGQRYIASGSSGKTIKIHGVPGNALGAYLNGTKIEVFANAQDAIGDTMNDGVIMVHGRCGDAPGYAMRGGRIYICLLYTSWPLWSGSLHGTQIVKYKNNLFVRQQPHLRLHAGASLLFLSLIHI